MTTAEMTAVRTYLKSNASVVFRTAHVERLVKARGATSVGDDKVFVAPFLAKDLGEEVMVRDGGNPIVGVVRRHDGSGAAVHDGSLERGEVEGAELALTSVDRGGVDALLGRTERGLFW